MKRTRLWLLRHTEPEESARGRCYGNLDVGLSPLGIQHAAEIAQALADEPFDAIYSSPLGRCTHLAARLAAERSRGPAMQALTLDGVRELNFGALEGHRYDQIAISFPETYKQWMECPAETSFPGGETCREMAARVNGALKSLLDRHAGQTVAVVTHAGVIRMMLAEALGMGLKDIFRIAQRFGAVNLVEYIGGRAVVELMNVDVAEGWRRDRDSNPG